MASSPRASAPRLTRHPGCVLPPPQLMQVARARAAVLSAFPSFAGPAPAPAPAEYVEEDIEDTDDSPGRKARAMRKCVASLLMCADLAARLPAAAQLLQMTTVPPIEAPVLPAVVAQAQGEQLGKATGPVRRGPMRGRGAAPAPAPAMGGDGVEMPQVCSDGACARR